VLSGAEQEAIIQKKMSKVSLELLEEKYASEREQNEHLNNLFARLQIDLDFFQRDIDTVKSRGNTLLDFQRIYFELLDRQRQLLTDMNHREEFDEELIRKYLSLIDMEEFKLRQKQLE
jgi:CPA1 family monovalent cation:H+ antiporter